MKKRVVISVYEVVGSPICVASGDGQKVYQRLFKVLKQHCSVSLSFLNVSVLTSAFLNAAIGQLYGEFQENEIRDLLRVENIEGRDTLLLRWVVKTAKQYFADPERFARDVREELGTGDDGE